MVDAVDFFARMDVKIENLVKLQALDLERARVSRDLRALPVEAEQARAALAAAERKSAEAADALSREETLRNRLERDTTAHVQKAARFRTQLDEVKTSEQAAAVEHELSFEAIEVKRLEDDAFASLERTEAQEAALAAARAQVESEADALEKTLARIAQRQAEYTAELSALTAERDALRPLIEADLLTRYDRLAASRGTAIARAENQQCPGCRMGVRPQVWNQLREGELMTCDSCGRFLYWDPAMTPVNPAPKAPQSDPSAGRAIRKSGHAGD